MADEGTSTNQIYNRLSKEGRAYLEKYTTVDANEVRTVKLPTTQKDIDAQRNEWDGLKEGDKLVFRESMGQLEPEGMNRLAPSAPEEGAGRRRRKGRKSRKTVKKAKKGGRRRKTSKMACW